MGASCQKASQLFSMHTSAALEPNYPILAAVFPLFHLPGGHLHSPPRAGCEQEAGRDPGSQQLPVRGEAVLITQVWNIEVAGDSEAHYVAKDMIA